LDDEKNHINIDLVNPLLVLEPSIIEKKNTFDEKQYESKDLQLTIDDYKLISQFNVIATYLNEVDIILGLN
jgi:hypothetical protein